MLRVDCWDGGAGDWLGGCVGHLDDVWWWLEPGHVWWSGEKYSEVFCILNIRLMRLAVRTNTGCDGKKEEPRMNPVSLTWRTEGRSCYYWAGEELRWESVWNNVPSRVGENCCHWACSQPFPAPLCCLWETSVLLWLLRHQLLTPVSFNIPLRAALSLECPRVCQMQREGKSGATQLAHLKWISLCI